MRKEELTPYDKYVISKNKSIPDLEEFESKIEPISNDIQEFSDSYKEYIKGQLRRSIPAKERVLTQEEFEREESEDARKSKMWQALGGQEDKTMTKKHAFTKSGKILFAAYVIILLCLALIVIVKTTVSINFERSADASNASDKIVASSIEAMEDEGDETNDNWFDRLCDSRK